MRKLITSIIMILIIGSIVGSTADIDLYKPGFKLWGWDINIMGLEIHNGTINGTRFITSNTTVVDNFNADMLDGTHGNGYVKTTDYNGDFPNNNITAENLAAWNNTQNSTYESQIAGLQENDTTDRAYVNNTFLPLSGGNMTGDVDMGGKNITNMTDMKGVHLVGIYSPNETLPLSIDNPECPISGSCSKYPLQVSVQNASAAFIYWTLGVNPNNYAYMKAIKTNGTVNNFNALGAGQFIFLVIGTGSDRTGSTSTGRGDLNPSKVLFGFRTSRQWSTSEYGTEIVFQTTLNNTARADALIIHDDKNITVKGLAGSGNDYTCSDSTGKQYRDDLGCS